MIVKVMRRSTGQIGYGSEYPRSTDLEILRWQVQFPGSGEMTVLYYDDPEFEVLYLDDVAVLEELICLNERVGIQQQQQL